jgi:hypothetical protein
MSTGMPRELNHALQVKLREWDLGFKEVPTLPALIKQYLREGVSPEIFKANLAQVFRRKVSKIPRKAARGGHESVPTPEVQLQWLIDDVLAIVEPAKLIIPSKNG